MMELGKEKLWKFSLFAPKSITIPFSFQNSEDKDVQNINFAGIFLRIWKDVHFFEAG